MKSDGDPSDKGWLSLLAWFICYLVIVIASIVMWVFHRN